jgi:hypothetical protein
MAQQDASRAIDVAQLYRELRRVPPHSEDFELLSAEFNRCCAADPLGVARAIDQESVPAVRVFDFRAALERSLIDGFNEAGQA